MDEFGDDYQQILSLPSPPIEAMAGPGDAALLARIANDGLADLVQRHPDRFPAFVASLPMNAPDAVMTEARRAIDDLGACGVQVFSNVNGAPLTSPELLPLFDLMAGVRPAHLDTSRARRRGRRLSDRTASQFEIWWTLGWPYETSVAMARIVFAGLFDTHPSLKIITHHMGGMIPFFEGRVGHGWDQLGTRSSDVDNAAVLQRLKRRPIDYFRLFYADTALFGAAAGTTCGLSFFGVDHVLFASDAPFEPTPVSTSARRLTSSIGCRSRMRRGRASTPAMPRGCSTAGLLNFLLQRLDAAHHAAHERADGGRVARVLSGTFHRRRAVPASYPP